RQRVSLVQLVGEAAGAAARGLVAVVQGDGVADDQRGGAPFVTQAVDAAPVRRTVVHVHHLQRAGAVTEAAGHGDADPPRSDVEAKYGSAAGDRVRAHARPE